MRLLKHAAALSLALPLASALIPIEVKNFRFIRPATNASEDGEVLQILGLDYQPGGSSGYDPSGDSDVLTDPDQILRDTYLFKQLGINTIRVYSVNPWLNHDESMSILNAAGIYLILDINNPFQSLARHHPADSYNTGYLNHIFGIVDAFKGYPNLLGFFAGNEVVNDAESAKISPPYVRAIIRDLKDYIALHANRTIPVGYSAADDKDLRTVMLQYLECQSGTNDTSAADFYGLNSYEWCSGRDDWQSSGYGNLLNDFKDTSIPIFLSEYGCNLNSPRTFDEVYDGLYANLSQVFSGGLVYEYAQEANDYGLVEINDDGNIKIDQDYSNLQAAYNKISLKTEYAADVPNTDRPICNSSYSKMITDQNSDFNASFSLPPCPNATFLQQGGGNSNIGKIIELKNNTSSYKIYNLDGNAIVNTTVEFSASDQINSPAGLSIGNAQSNSSDTESPSSTSSVVSSETAASSTSTSKAGADTLEYRGTGLFALLCGVAFML